MFVLSGPLSSSLTDVRERPAERTIRRLFWALAHAPTRFWARTDVRERPEERTFSSLRDVREGPEERTLRRLFRKPTRFHESALRSLTEHEFLPRLRNAS